MNKDLIDKLKGIEGIELLIDKDLFRYTTMRLHVRGDLAIVKTRNALRNVIRLLNENQYPYNLVGWGANQIIVHPDHTLFIQLDFPFDRSTLDTTHDEYILPASTPLNILTSHAKKFGLMGWEVFTGIPASLGGAIFMNAGTNLGEISEIVKEVEVLKKDGSLVLHQVDEHSFSYRKCHFVNKGDIILSAKLVHKGKSPEIKSKISEYIALRKKTQPLSTKNCGCVFKNFDQGHRAGHYIDLMGLKGFHNGKVRISHIHANFFENYNEASALELSSHIDHTQQILEQFCGIKFELEVKLY